MVALDGSLEAEAILPYVEPIAWAFTSRVTLVCALEPLERAVPGAMALSEGDMAAEIMQSVFDTHDLLGQDDASYLVRVRNLWTARGIDVECREPQLPAPEAIVMVARETGADLIAMATHGRSGIARAVHGSVADEVVRTAPCPVLLVKPE